MFRKLSSSLAWWALGLICAASFGLMFRVSRTDSAIDDELAHIPAGYGYVSQLAYRLNPEHPPLIKALAMLPVLLLHPVYPTQSAAWQTEVNGEWDMGRQFLYESGNNANEIIQTGRIFPILITILTVIFIYLLARRLMGNWWALLPSFLFAFDPNILANGHYVTTDVGAAFGVVFATYFFLKFLDAPSIKNLWFAGISFGIAQLTKFSLPFLTIIFVFLTLILWLREMLIQNKFGFHGLRWLWKLILIVVIGYVFIVYPVYFLFTVRYPIAKQISDTTAILASFATGPTPAGQLCKGMRCLADLDIWMAKNPVARPYAEYLLGILMVLQRTDAGNTIYFLGRVVNSGGWIYFPALFLLKEPIPSLIIIFLALALAVWWMIRETSRNKTFQNNLRAFLDYLGLNFPEFSMASFIVLYWCYSMHAPLNLGIRYILPTFPFIFILAGGVWKKWVMRIRLPGTNVMTATLASLADSAARTVRSLAAASLKYIFLIFLLAWLTLETLIAAPYFLSYYNEFGGGVSNGYHYATDSNYDWGQDLLRLQSFVAAHPEINKIAVDYFGGGDPQYYLGAKEVDWSSAKGNPANQGIDWIAISIDKLQGAIQPLAPGEIRNASDTYSWLTAIRPPATGGMGNVPTPDYRVGTSIFVYHL